ncbi:MAG: hypothetical protein KAG97_09980, partial [Victivallales bacterium]|nr:hypothetical protein [Victivallales bacterium]
MRMSKCGLIGSFIVCVAIAEAADDFSKELSDVKAGTRKEAKASWWGFDKRDATKCLQNAINSGVRILIVDNTGFDWIVTPIKAVDNQTIIFQDGVVLRAKKGEFKGRGDMLFD